MRGRQHGYFSSGVGAYRMSVPKEVSGYELEHTELIVYLPEDWNLSSDDEKDYWPIRLLKIIGRIPINLSRCAA